MTAATIAMNRFVQNMKSYGFGLTPNAFEVFLIRFCMPPVTPSHANDAKINKIPINDDAGPDFLPKDTRTVPAIIEATARYSRRVYLAPPNNNVPIITGTILPDLARVTTGKETPDAKANEVKALAQT